ncbi:MAG: GntR family transcriptional regulator [Fusobacteriaceae bacterium]
MESINVKNLTKLVKENIYKYIKNLDYGHSNKLPSEDDLSSLLNVSRITVRSALNELASEGLIFRKHGKGTFINVEALKMNVQLTPMKAFSEIIKNSGYSTSVKNINYVIKELDDEKIAKELRIPMKEKVVVAKKTFYADKTPCVYCIDYFPASLLLKEESCEDIKKYENSIFDFFHAECNKKIIWEKSEISTTTTLENVELKKIFKCDNEIKSFLVITGTNYDDNNKPLIYAKEYVNTNIINFSFVRQRIVN